MFRVSDLAFESQIETLSGEYKERVEPWFCGCGKKTVPASRALEENIESAKVFSKKNPGPLADMLAEEIEAAQEALEFVFALFDNIRSSRGSTRKQTGLTGCPLGPALNSGEGLLQIFGLNSVDNLPSVALQTGSGVAAESEKQFTFPNLDDRRCSGCGRR